MNDHISLGEYVHRLRRRKNWQLQQLAEATGLSISHLSRIENDSAIPNADSVVKLAAALDGDLSAMLLQAECLPREILDRYVRRAAGRTGAVRRAAGNTPDTAYAEALVEDMDARLRATLAQAFNLSEHDTEGMFSLLQRIARLPEAHRVAFLDVFASEALGDSHDRL